MNIDANINGAAKRQADPDIPLGLYRPIVLCFVALVASAVVFYLFPGIDLAVSSPFFVRDQGFYLGKTLPIVAIRNFGISITVLTIVGLIAVGLWWSLRPDALRQWPSVRPWTDWLFMAACMAVGPGLVVNLIFKPVWGRARPVHIGQFGGRDQFTSAWTVAGQCKWNCSFVSGEAAASALILAFCFVVPARWRMTALLAACAVTLAVSFARIAAGGHFFSDVVTAWILMLLVILVLRAQIYHGALLGPLKQWLPSQ